MANLFVRAISDEIVNLTDKYKKQVQELSGTLAVYRAIMHRPTKSPQLPSAHCLIIKINHADEDDNEEEDDHGPYNPFMFLDFEERWVYAVSNDTAVLESFKSKILSYTPEKYRHLLDIIIIDSKCMTKVEIESNFSGNWQGPFSINVLYFEGIVNRDGTNAWTLEEFTEDKWRFNWGNKPYNIVEEYSSSDDGE
jgi:hypothetical protein